MSQPLNGPQKYWVTGGVLLGMIVGFFVSDCVGQRKLSEAHAKAARLEERAARVDRLEEKRAWERVEQAADAFLKHDPKDDKGKELQARFCVEFHRWKSRYGYPQLGAGR